MRKKYLPLLIMVAFAFTSMPSINPIADTTIVAEAHGNHGGHHGCGSSYQSDIRENGHYHCGGHSAHSHENGICPYNTSETYCDGSSICYESCEWNQEYHH